MGFRTANLREALRDYEQAVALDPGFALAWAKVARTGSFLYALVKSPELAQRTREAAEKAIAMAPDLPEAHTALGSYHGLVLGDIRRALELHNEARRMAPGSADVLFATGAAEFGLGNFEASIEHLREAERLDPRSVLVKERLAASLIALRR